MSLRIFITQSVLPLVPIQHNTPRHRAHGYFRRNCQFGFSGSHVGAFSHPWQYTHLNCGSQVTPARMTCISLNFVAADSCRLTGRILFCAIWTGISLNCPPLEKIHFGPQMTWNLLKQIYPIKYGYTEEFWIWSYP